MSCLIWGVDQGSCAWVLVPSSWVSLLNLMLQGSLRGIWFHRAWAPRLSAEGSAFLGGTPVFSGIELEIQDGVVCKRGPVNIPWLQILWFQFYDYKFLLRVCLYAKSLQSCLSLCDPMDCSLPGSSVPGIHQAAILEWVAVPSSRGSSWPRDRTQVCKSPAAVGTFFNHWRHLGSPQIPPTAC